MNLLQTIKLLTGSEPSRPVKVAAPIARGLNLFQAAKAAGFDIETEAEFVEEEHPRDEKGRFVEKGAPEAPAQPTNQTELDKALLNTPPPSPPPTPTPSEPSTPSYKTATWDNVPARIQEKVQQHWLEGAYENAWENIDLAGLRNEFEQELRDNNSDIVKQTEKDTLRAMQHAFPNPNPGLLKDTAGQEVVTYRQLDPDTLVYDEDRGDGAVLDLNALRFKDGTPLTDREQSAVGRTWNEFYDANFTDAMDNITGGVGTLGEQYDERRNELENEAIDEMWQQMDDSDKLQIAYDLGYGDEDFNLEERTKSESEPTIRYKQPASSEEPKGPAKSSLSPAEKFASISDLSKIDPDKSKRIGGGMTSGLMKVYFSNGQAAIFKPASGEGDAFGGERGNNGRGIGGNGEQGKREVASWELARAIGVEHIVPPAIYDKVKNVEGSLQYWSTGEETGDVHGVPKDQRMAAAVFDYLSGQTDRRAANWKYDSDTKQLALIDNGLSFPTNHNFYIWNHDFLSYGLGHEIPDSIKSKLTPDNLKAIKPTLSKYINAKALAQFEIRWNRLAKATSFDDLGVGGGYEFRFEKQKSASA